MALAIDKENYLLHKVHSLTGIVPVGYYMVQHLVLNSFTIAGPEKFNAVIGFFEGMPKFFLLTLEVCAIWLPLLFHAIYGLFIVSRAKPNYFGSVYGWSQNLMYTLTKLTSNYCIWLVVYMIGIAAAAYHLAYGIWNFSIRWGFTVSDKAQNTVQKFAFAFFVVITLIGWGALGGFLIHGNHSSVTQTTDSGTTQVSRDYKNVLAVR